MSNLSEIIKMAAGTAWNQSQPCDITAGVVTGTEPLCIETDDHKILTAAFLVLAREVTEYTIELSVDHTTEDETAHTHGVVDTYTGGGSSLPTAHGHAYKGRKKFVVHNALVVGERVIMMRSQGGQKYYVIDRIGGRG